MSVKAMTFSTGEKPSEVGTPAVSERLEKQLKELRALPQPPGWLPEDFEDPDPRYNGDPLRKHFHLNDEQREAANHGSGPGLVLAAAGSGKTQTLTARVVNIVRHYRVHPTAALCITFTNKAANNMRERIQRFMPGDALPHVSTIHALGMLIIRNHPIHAFRQLCAQGGISPEFGEVSAAVDKKKVRLTLIVDYAQKKMMGELMKHHSLSDLGRPGELLFRISVLRMSDQTPDSYEKLVRKEGKTGITARLRLPYLNSDEIFLWEKYEEAKANNHVIDFTDMIAIPIRILERNPKLQEYYHRLWPYIMLDEAQDTAPLQWRLLKAVLSNENNVFAVGDVAQCQPPETLVTKLVRKGDNRRGVQPVLEQVRMDSLKDGDKVVSWTRKDQRCYVTAPREIQVAANPYKGDLVSITLENGSKTRVTPNHWVWTRFNFTNCSKSHIVYLMFKEGLGFRIGVTNLKKSVKVGSHNCRSFGLKFRMTTEDADSAWILKVCEDKDTAIMWEQILSAKYGILQSVFNDHGCINKTDEMIKFMFSQVSQRGGFECLQQHGLLFEQPLITKNDGFQGARGFIKTAAANLIPGLMELPVMGAYKSVAIKEISLEFYEGLVYSLNVEQDHTYVADGIVVGNSIMGFNGSDPRIIRAFKNDFRGVIPQFYHLSKNYRSHMDIIEVANKLERTHIKFHPRPMEAECSTVDNTKGALFYNEYHTAEEEARDIARKIKIYNRNADFAYRECAVLVRTKAMFPVIENALLAQAIPYYVKDSGSLLGSKEIQDLMAYLRFADNSYDAISFARAVQNPKRGYGDTSIERLVASAQLNRSSILESARTQPKLYPFVQLIEEIQGAIAEDALTPQPVSQVIEYLIKKINYMAEVDRTAEKSHNAREDKIRREQNIERFLMLLKELEASGRVDNFESLQDFLDLNYDPTANKGDANQVQIMTAHSSKGLEFGVVFAPCFFQGAIPHFLSKTEEDINEEGRLSYVIVTRAINELHISRSLQFMSARGPMPTQPSMFYITVQPEFKKLGKVN